MNSHFSNSRIELSEKNLINNINFIKKFFGKKPKLSIVVKGRAYGHGYSQFIPMLIEQGIDHFSVFSAEEAFELLKHTNDKSTILIMGHVPSESLAWIAENHIHFYIYSIERIKELISYSLKYNKKFFIHLEIETGMKRTGLDDENLEEAISLLKKNKKHLKLIGICTHLAGAESITNYLRIKKQIKTFQVTLKKIKAKGLKWEMSHCACSAAAVRYPSTKMDLIRIGILAYGFWPSQEILIEYLNKTNNHTNPLKRVISWKSKIMAIKNIKRGDYVGYGNVFQAPRDMKLAVIPIGYESGFSRNLSNRGSVLIKGQFCFVLGTINMNALTVNISHLTDVKPGDDVILIGKDGENEITVASFYDLGEQLNYELLTRLPLSIPREVTNQ